MVQWFVRMDIIHFWGKWAASEYRRFVMGTNYCRIYQTSARRCPLPHTTGNGSVISNTDHTQSQIEPYRVTWLSSRWIDLSYLVEWKVFPLQIHQATYHLTWPFNLIGYFVSSVVCIETSGLRLLASLRSTAILIVSNRMIALYHQLIYESHW